MTRTTSCLVVLGVIAGGAAIFGLDWLLTMELLDSWLASAIPDARWIAVTGQAFDLAGAAMMAVPAWAKMETKTRRSGSGEELGPAVESRRVLVVVGGAFLVLGFALQMASGIVQIARAG